MTWCVYTKSELVEIKIHPSNWHSIDPYKKTCPDTIYFQSQFTGCRRIPVLGTKKRDALYIHLKWLKRRVIYPSLVYLPNRFSYGTKSTQRISRTESSRSCNTRIRCCPRKPLPPLIRPIHTTENNHVARMLHIISGIESHTASENDGAWFVVMVIWCAAKRWEGSGCVVTHSIRVSSQPPRCCQIMRAMNPIHVGGGSRRWWHQAKGGHGTQAGHRRAIEDKSEIKVTNKLD